MTRQMIYQLKVSESQRTYSADEPIDVRSEDRLFHRHIVDDMNDLAYEERWAQGTINWYLLQKLRLHGSLPTDNFVEY